MLRNRILREVMAENGWANISKMSEEQAKELKAKTDVQAENKFVVDLFIYIADSGCYDKLKT